jgi:hypothetical protein
LSYNGAFEIAGVIMDIDKLIRELNSEIDKLIHVVGYLEELRCTSGTSATPSRRGRKSMGTEERQEVSARMKKYWANRRRASRISSK